MNFSDYILKNKINYDKKIFIDGELTYSNLYQSVNKSKEIFSKYKKKLIGISLNNSEQFLILYLSVIKSGNIAVLIEKGLSNERYQKILNKFNLDYFVTDIDFNNNNISKKFNKKKMNENFVKSNKIFFYSRKQSKSKDNIDEKIALILFTSGSSGEKKGVMLTHKNLIFNTNSILKILPIKKNDIVNLLLPANYSFGLSIINTHLKVGGSIYLHNSPFVGSVINEIKKFKCTSIYGVPSTFEILLKKTDFIKNNFPTLRYLAQAGGNLDIDYKKILLEKFREKIFIMYGATEASPRLSYVPPKKLKTKIASIGIPIPGVKFKLFKYKNTKLFQLGVTGNNIMKGYFKDKKSTKESFNGKYYLTGDLGYKDKDNYYYVNQRVDKIVKRYGYKINLNQISKTIKKIKFIEFCKTFIVKRKLITIVQSNIDDKKYLKEDIIKELRKNFASYEIPDEIYITKKSLKSTYKKLALEDLLETIN